MVIVILCEYSPAPTLVTAWICGRTVGERGRRGEREGEGEDREGKGREGREKGKREQKREGKRGEDGGEEMWNAFIFSNGFHIAIFTNTNTHTANSPESCIFRHSTPALKDHILLQSLLSPHAQILFHSVIYGYCNTGSFH